MTAANPISPCTDRRIPGQRILSLCLAPVLLAGAACSLDLGDVPFFCNTGTPRCPDGYQCTAGYCHREGECPEAIPGCPKTSGGDAGVKLDKGKVTDVDPGPVTGIKGKFCNNLKKRDGTTFWMNLGVGTVYMKATTGQCSACMNLPVGQNSYQLLMEGEKDPVESGTMTLEKGKEYLFVSVVPATSTASYIDGGALKPGYTCATVNPFASPDGGM